VAVYVLVEVTNAVVEATVRGPGDVPKVAVKGWGVIVCWKGLKRFKAT
jgi:hypothetical protein